MEVEVEVEVVGRGGMAWACGESGRGMPHRYEKCESAFPGGFTKS